MKRSLLFVVMLAFISITGCSKSHTDQKTELQPSTDLPSEKKKQEVKSEEAQHITEIQLSLDGKLESFNLDSIPLLQRYLDASVNPDIEINRMKATTISYKDQKIYLIAYSCSAKNCSYILVNEQEQKSQLVADIAIFQTVSFSPDETKLMLLFKRPEVHGVTRDAIVIVDLNSFEQLPLRNLSNEQTTLHFNYPILSSRWVDNNSVQIEIPMVKDTSFEELYKWTNGNQSKTTLILKIKEK